MYTRFITYSGEKIYYLEYARELSPVKKNRVERRRQQEYAKQSFRVNLKRRKED